MSEPEREPCQHPDVNNAGICQNKDCNACLTIPDVRVLEVPPTGRTLHNVMQRRREIT